LLVESVLMVNNDLKDRMYVVFEGVFKLNDELLKKE